MRILYPLILILFAAGNAFAQNTIELSKEKVKIDGKTFYAHQVKKKETLYSLGKAYGVTTDVIVKNNASLATGLKEGTVIYIPIADAAEISAAPVVEDASQQKSPKTSKQKKYKRHTVKWYEDITDISEKYNVPVEALIAFNNLPSGKLKTRQVLQIPDAEYLATFATNKPAGDVIANPQETPTQPAVIETVTTSDSTVVKTQDEDIENKMSMSRVQARDKNQPLDIAIVLPLNSGTPEALSSNFMDFYAGALLAINDFKEKESKSMYGYSRVVPEVNVNIYDLTEYNPLHTLLDAPGFEKNQLIIGPARASRLNELAGFAVTHQIPLISPLDNNAEAILDECPYMVQVPTAAEQQLKNLVDQLVKQYREQPAPVLLVSENGGADASYVDATKRLLDANSIPYQNISYGILDGRTISETMLSIVDTLSGTPNLAIVPSNSEAFVSDVVRNLDICHNYGNTRMIVYGMPKWRNFETIYVELYHKLNLHLSIPYYVEYGTPEVDKFLMRYRALYNTEPTPYSYQGYDITSYFLDLANRYGKSFINLDQFAPAQMLQSSFIFQRYQTSSGVSTGVSTNVTSGVSSGVSSEWAERKDRHNCGLINCATRNIIYNPDYTITLESR